jgi:hypothetical protein
VGEADFLSHVFDPDSSEPVTKGQNDYSEMGYLESLKS